MPHYKTAFPSKYLWPRNRATERHHDRNGGIRNVGNDDKPEKKLVATFEHDAHKAIVLNKPVAKRSRRSRRHPDYLKWPGTRVNVSQGWTRYAGKKVACIVMARRAHRTMTTFGSKEAHHGLDIQRRSTIRRARKRKTFMR